MKVDPVDPRDVRWGRRLLNRPRPAWNDARIVALRAEEDESAAYPAFKQYVAQHHDIAAQVESLAAPWAEQNVDERRRNLHAAYLLFEPTDDPERKQACDARVDAEWGKLRAARRG